MIESFRRSVREFIGKGVGLWRSWPVRARKSAKIGAALLSLLLTAVLVLPDIGLRWGLFEGMKRLGMTEVSLSDAEIKLFDGRLVLRSFLARSAIGNALGLERLDFAFRWTPLLRRELSVQNLDLSGLAIGIEHETKRIYINGAPIDLDGASDAQSPWSFDIDAFRLSSSRIDLFKDGLHIPIDVERLEIDRLSSVTPNAQARLYFKGSISGGSVEISGHLTPFSAQPAVDLALALRDLDLALLAPLLEKFAWRDLAGKLDANLAISGEPRATIGLKGRIEAKSISLGKDPVLLKGDAIALFAEGLSWNAQSGRLFWQGSGTVERAFLTSPDFEAAPQRLSWQGSIDARMTGQESSFKIDGQFEDAGLVLSTPEIEIAHGGLAGTLNLDLSPKEEGAGFEARLGFDANRFSVTDRKAGLALIDAPRLAAASVRLHGGRLPAEGGLRADELLIDDLLLRLVRKAVGEASQAGGGTPMQETEKALEPRLQLGRFSIGGKSRLEFTDRSASRPVELAFDRIRLNLTDIDSRRPGHNSPFELSARAGAATLSAEGWARPFAPRATLKLGSRVKAFELPPLSPYLADILGVELQTGHFDGDVALALDNGAIDGKLDLALSNLFTAEPPSQAPKAERGGGLPVPLLLDLLRDGESRIRLAIPLGGDLGDPKFDLSDAVGQAIGGALKQTALSTLKLVFPVLLLVDGLSAGQSPALAPVTFQPGDDQPDDMGRSRLAVLGDLLRERPGVKLSLCPKSSAARDWPVLLERRKLDELGLIYKMQKLVKMEAKPETVKQDDEALFALAERRALGTKSILIDEAGIEPGRLFACRPQIDSAADALPRVDPML